MISSPASLSCLDPGLSIEITRHCAVKKPSSESTSTACPFLVGNCHAASNRLVSYRQRDREVFPHVP